MLRYVFIICFLSTALLKGQIKDDEIYVLEKPRDYAKDPARTATYIELGGNGAIYSLNLDHILLYKEKLKISGRGGVAVYPNGYRMEQAYIIENNYILFSNPHHLEIGPGLTLQRKFQETCSDTTKASWESLYYGMFRIGYRFQKQEDGFFFRFGILGIPYKKDDCGVEIPPQNKFWVGISVGISY